MKKGLFVTEALLQDLRVLKVSAQQEDRTLEFYHFQELADLVEARRLFGQPLMTLDGRNGKEDAMQELGDLLQYVKKISMSRELSLEDRLEFCDLLKTAFKVMRVLLRHGDRKVE